MYKVEFTKEEVEAAMIQIGARIDALGDIQKEAGRKEDIARVLQLEEAMKPIKSFRQKLIDAKVR